MSISTQARPLRSVLVPVAIVVGITVVAVVGGAVSLLLRPLEYQATAQLVVTPVSRDNDTLVGLPLVRDLGDPIRTVETAAAVFENRQVAERVAGAQGRDTADVVASVDVAPLAQTNVLQVTARGETPEEAAALATAYAQAVVEVRSQALSEATREAVSAAEAQRVRSAGAATSRLDERLADLQVLLASGDPTLALAETAVPPTTPSGPPPWLVLMLSACAGLALGVAAAVGLRALRGQQPTARGRGTRANDPGGPVHVVPTGVTQPVSTPVETPTSTSTSAMQLNGGEPARDGGPVRHRQAPHEGASRRTI